MTPGKPKVIGIDLGASVIKYALVKYSGDLSEYGESTTPSGRDEILDELVSVIQSLSETPSARVGVATPGVVDVGSGKVLSGAVNIPGWSGVEIAGILSEKTGSNVRVDNDANAMALAESSFGAARGARSAICITIGTGIGGALIIDGKLWRGATFSAGEIGQVALNVSGSADGDRNWTPVSLESVTATRALVGKLRQETGEDFSARRILESYQEGESVAVRAISEICEVLGAELANLVNVLNPERVILGGGVVDAAPGVVEKIKTVIMRRAISSATAKLSVLPAELGNKAGLVGAALLGFNADTIRD